jgi:hypothetical protein
VRTRRRSTLLPDVQKCAEQIASHPLELKRHGKLAAQLSAVWKGNLFAWPNRTTSPLWLRLLIAPVTSSPALTLGLDTRSVRRGRAELSYHSAKAGT